MNDDSPNYLVLILAAVVAVMVLGIWIAAESAAEAEVAIKQAMECRRGSK